MILNKIINSVSEAFIVAGYSRTASELSALSDKQLAEMGISRTLLEQGVSAYPWREETQSQEVSDNVTSLQFENKGSALDLSNTQKAA